MNIKRFLVLIIALFLFIPSVFSAEWVEMFEKQYIDNETVKYNANTHIVHFWVKSLRKDPNKK